MNKTTEALKQAEEALGNSQQYLDLHNPQWVDARRQNDKALAAIREALADQSPDATKMVGCAYCDNPLFAGTKCNNCGRVTLAEPVKTYEQGYLDGYDAGLIFANSRALWTVKQEPVAWVDEDGFPWKYNLDGKDWVPLYAAPVRTKDLTDIEYLQDAVTKALKKAFHLGQTYWQQADSESYAANKKADVTQELFFKLKDDTRAVIAADREKNR